jgi:hypothetical protein
MVKVHKYGLTVLSMNVIGEMEKRMEKVELFMQMALFTKVNRKTIKLTGMVSTYIQMGIYTRATGKKINNMERARRPGPMALSMRVTTSRERKTETEISDGLTDPPTMDNYKITLCTVKACLFGLTNVSTKVNGRMIKCMVKVYFHGLMGVSTKVITMKTINKVTVYLPGQMVANTKENGLMANSTVKQFTNHLRVRPKEENGKKERDLDGFLSEK